MRMSFNLCSSAGGIRVLLELWGCQTSDNKIAQNKNNQGSTTMVKSFIIELLIESNQESAKLGKNNACNKTIIFASISFYGVSFRAFDR